MRDINSLNRVLLVGRVGQKPEIRYLPQKERALARFSLATNERLFNPGTRETSDRTEWHRIVAWARLAEICGEYLSKGKQIYIEGRLQTRSWEDREGNKRTTTEIVATQMQMLGAAPQQGARPASQAHPREDKPPSGGRDVSRDDDGSGQSPSSSGSDRPAPDDDIPF